MLYLKALMITLCIAGFIFILPMLVYLIPLGIVFLIVLAVLSESKKKPP